MAWTLDTARKVWVTSDYSDLDATAINNLAEYGQPFTPYEHPGFQQDFVPDFANVTVEMSQLQVMTNGYGRSMTAEHFDLITRFLDSTKSPALPYGTFTFDDLLRRKYATSSSDRWYHTNLYGSWGSHAITAGNLDPGDAAYVHGSVSFALMGRTKFINDPAFRRVSAEIGAGNDNWDFNSATVPTFVNVAVATIVGPDNYNLEAPIKIQFTGPGVLLVVEARTKIPATLTGQLHQLRGPFR